jgi:hypothetical protein
MVVPLVLVPRRWPCNSETNQPDDEASFISCGDKTSMVRSGLVRTLPFCDFLGLGLDLVGLGPSYSFLFIWVLDVNFSFRFFLELDLVDISLSFLI